MIPTRVNADVRARTHIKQGGAVNAATSTNSRPHPHLRVVDGGTHITNTAPEPPVNHTAEAIGDLADAIATHPVVDTLPPTWREAVHDIWPDESPYGLPGQIGSALVGIVQAIGLAVCWAVAHVAFATKTRTLIALLALLISVAAYVVANLATA